MAERTKLWIAAAMKRLMAKKPLDKIRVTEICREAEIERPTFYYHFQDKNDLVAWIFFRDADSTDILSVASAAESMNRLREELLSCRRAYEDPSLNALWQHMLELLAERYTRLAKEKLGVDQLDAQTQYSIRLYCCGTVGMTREWLMQDSAPPAESVVRMMFASMPEKLRQICGL